MVQKVFDGSQNAGLCYCMRLWDNDRQIDMVLMLMKFHEVAYLVIIFTDFSISWFSSVTLVGISESKGTTYQMNFSSFHIFDANM